MCYGNNLNFSGSSDNPLNLLNKGRKQALKKRTLGTILVPNVDFGLAINIPSIVVFHPI